MKLRFLGIFRISIHQFSGFLRLNLHGSDLSFQLRLKLKNLSLISNYKLYSTKFLSQQLLKCFAVQLKKVFAYVTNRPQYKH